jgi:hypothetical protein
MDYATRSRRLAELRRRESEIKARIAQEEAREKGRARKEDTREKVLIGAAFIADMKQHPETRAAIKAVVERAMTATRDREFLKSKGWI